MPRAAPPPGPKLVIPGRGLAQRWRHEVVRAFSGCHLCPIGRLANKKSFARGRLPCDVLFVGEGPGKTEDIFGWPFIGRAGRLLDVWLKATEFDLAYAITNTVMCRPCNARGGDNRKPKLVEQRKCLSRLRKIVELTNPHVVVFLGRVAEDHYHEFRPYGDRPVLKLDHPAYVLRLGGVKAKKHGTNWRKLRRFLEDHFDSEG